MWNVRYSNVSGNNTGSNGARKEAWWNEGKGNSLVSNFNVLKRLFSSYLATSPYFFPLTSSRYDFFLLFTEQLQNIMGIDGAGLAGGVRAGISRRSIDIRLRFFSLEFLEALRPFKWQNNCLVTCHSPKPVQTPHSPSQLHCTTHKQSADYLLRSFPSPCLLVPICDFPICSNKQKRSKIVVVASFAASSHVRPGSAV